MSESGELRRVLRAHGVAEAAADTSSARAGRTAQTPAAGLVRWPRLLVPVRQCSKVFPDVRASDRCALRYSWARRAFAFSQSLGVIVGLYLQEALYQQTLQVPHGEPVVEKPPGLPGFSRAKSRTK